MQGIKEKQPATVWLCAVLLLRFIKYCLWTYSPEDKQQASKQASKQASRQARKQAGRQASKQASEQPITSTNNSNRRRNVITWKLVSSTYFCILQTSTSQHQTTKAQSNPGPKDHNRRTLDQGWHPNGTSVPPEPTKGATLKLMGNQDGAKMVNPRLVLRYLQGPHLKIDGC